MGRRRRARRGAGGRADERRPPRPLQHCNVASKADVDAAVAATLAAFGRIDALVNNAGIFRAADFLDITEADWDAVIAVNLKGAFLVGQAVARAMAANKSGAIVNMSSVNGVMAIPSIASYNASKGGIDQLTRVMALALADRGIRVNAVAPGTIATELAKNAVLTSDEARDRIMSRTPLRRLGEPDEIADAVAFLLSDASSYISGEILYVDGGRRALNYTMAPLPLISALWCWPAHGGSLSGMNTPTTTTLPPLAGGCLCRRVRYEAAPEHREGYYCHCRMCQLAFGNTRASFLNLRKDQVRWTGEPPKYYASSKFARRGFCPDCGTPLSFEYLDSEHMDLSVGSLDDPAALSRFRISRSTRASRHGTATTACRASASTNIRS